MADVVILGAGTFAVEVLEAAELSGLSVRGFLVSSPEFAGSALLERLPVHTPDALTWTPADIALVAGIVSTKRQPFIERMAAQGFTFVAVRHPSAMVSPRADAASGSMIGAGAIVGAHAVLGPHVILNRGANIAHDVSVGAYATVGPGAIVAGAVRIGARAWIGAGAVVRDHLTIGEGAVIAAGAVVVRSVPPRTLVVGVPAAVGRDGVDGY